MLSLLSCLVYEGGVQVLLPYNNAGVTHCHLCAHGQLGVFQMRFAKQVIVVAAYPILSLISLSKEKFLVKIELR